MTDPIHRIDQAAPSTVVLLPSLGRGAADFDQLVASFREGGFLRRALDPTPAAAVAPDATLHDLAARVVEQIDGLGTGRVHLVGHAFGQRLARCVVADHPDRVATLTMLAAGGLVPMPEDIAASLGSCFDRSLDPDAHLEHVRRVFFAPGNDPAVWAGGWFPAVAAYQSAAVRRTPPGDWTDATGARVLVVQGLQDASAVPENGRRYVAAHPDVASLVEIDGAGHALLPERPDEVATAVLGFLGRGPER